MHTYRYYVSLRIWHPTDDPSTFTTVLGLEPDYLDVAGQPRVRKGKTQEVVSSESYWCHAFDIGVEQDIEDFLSATADRLAAHSCFFERVCSSGGCAELFIGFIVESINCGFVLSPLLQRKYASLNLILSFDIYGMIQEETDEA